MLKVRYDDHLVPYCVLASQERRGKTMPEVIDAGDFLTNLHPLGQGSEAQGRTHARRFGLLTLDVQHVGILEQYGRSVSLAVAN